MPFSPKLTRQDVFWAQGHLSAAVGPNFEQELYHWLADNRSPALVIDFGGVKFLDSAVLMILVKVYKQIRAQGKTLMVSGVSPELKIIFELTQLDRVFCLYPNPEAAFASLSAVALAA